MLRDVLVDELAARQGPLVVEAAHAKERSISSPDGNWIAFSSNRGGGRYQLWVMRADGTDARQVTTDAEPYEFVEGWATPRQTLGWWSPSEKFAEAVAMTA